MTTNPNPVTYHKHLALIRAATDQEFLEQLSQLEDQGYRVADVGKDIRYQGPGIIALMCKPEPEPIFEIEDVPEPRREAPPDMAIS